jgi:hypothetical protein
MGQNDVWAVGSYFAGDGSTSQIIEHWDGAVWSLVSGPPIGVSASLTSVVAIASNDVWAAGTKDSSDGSHKVTLTEHWDGDAWTIVASPPSTGSSGLSGLFATGSTDVNGGGNDALERTQPSAGDPLERGVLVDAIGAGHGCGFRRRLRHGK